MSGSGGYYTDMHELSIQTYRRDQYLEITREVQRVVNETSVTDGLVVVFVPHTTAGVTINENADPDVVTDTIEQLDRMVPWSQPVYRHGEGNSDSHVKASLVGSSQYVIVADGRLVLGTWQAIFFCEFDGPRSRKAHIRVGAS